VEDVKSGLVDMLQLWRCRSHPGWFLCKSDAFWV